MLQSEPRGRWKHKLKGSSGKEPPAAEPLPCAACPEGWIGFGSKCFYFSDNIRNWTSSQLFCASEKANLVHIDSQEELDFLERYTDRFAHWIGLSRESSNDPWEWVDNAGHNVWSGLETTLTSSDVTVVCCGRASPCTSSGCQGCAGADRHVVSPGLGTQSDQCRVELSGTGAGLWCRGECRRQCVDLTLLFGFRFDVTGDENYAYLNDGVSSGRGYSEKKWICNKPNNYADKCQIHLTSS
ncbi:C-type lectin domain family 2 member D11 [Galemys pyrenaicus]|uniref:C-type lectin domain family 2 member D11 n=1 Tax=Galemys pyrenaicus TaxID=202257 RepID=A0A8J6DF39_GALPY|nr:C-type lectin domain family 2 member D11 [Galemys pyrenaicus]